MGYRHDYVLYQDCPVCSSSITTWRIKTVAAEQYTLDRCKSCGYCFVNPRPSFEFLMDYYASYGHGHIDGSGAAPTLESVLKQERDSPNSTIDARRTIETIKSLLVNADNQTFLDVGCGYGFFSKEALREGFDVVALELAERERSIAHEMTNLQPHPTSFEDFEGAPESTGVVFMSQILEHALDVNLWIKKSHLMLVRNGILAIALPNFGSIFRLAMQENEPYICPPAHLNFFSRRSLSALLKKHGFEVERTQWVSSIPRSTFDKRLPDMMKPLLPAVTLASSVALKLIDTMRLGMMINVYARKIA